MKIIIVLIPLFIVLGSGSPASSQIENNQLDWSSLQKAFKTYAEYPSSENAMKIMEILPDSYVTYTGSKQEKEAFDFIYNREQFGMLERQVLSRDRVAVKLAFKLVTFLGV
jgi:hypothetical protein